MKLLVVDGNSILNRAYYGVRPLTTKDGQFTNAIYGFMNMLQKIKEETAPDCVAIAFDMKAPTFRHKAFAGYKAQRKGMPEELASQLQPLKDLLCALGYRLVECEGYEADDILGTLSLACEQQGGSCVIATGDRDSLQLVSDNTTVRLASTKQGTPFSKLYGVKEILDEYGVDPRGLIEIKALQGDSSDNIPGVAGIGPKGASDLIKKYKTIQYIYDNIESLEIRDTVRAKLEAGKNSAFMSRMLGEICRTVPIDTDIKNYPVSEGDPQRAVRIMTKLELFSFIDKLNLRGITVSESGEKEEQAAEIVLSHDDMPVNDGEFAILPVFEGKEIKSLYTCAADKPYSVFLISDQDKIRSLLQNNGISKEIYNSKPAFAFADENGFDFSNVSFDVCLAAYILNPSASDYSLERLCGEYFIPVAGFEDKNAALCAAIPPLCEKLKAKLCQNGQENLLVNMEIPLARVLAEMENSGFRVDREGIENYGEQMDLMINELNSKICSEVGYDFNVNSPKQLGVALFEKLMLPGKKKPNTRNGYTTNAEVLEKLRPYHPVVDMILNYRAYTKLKNTYCDGLLKVIGEDGRIHSSFNQTETRTGRISSTEPNLQNIPVRTELGREMRRFFCAGDGMLLVDADYSQIELRVLAHLADDEKMKDAFKSGKDIHTITASQVFNLPESMITPMLRGRAKAVNFGIVYGIGAYSLAKDINVTNREAADYINAYLHHYSGVAGYMDRMIEKATRDGYAETMFGRRRYLPELTAGNKNTRAFGQRVARNMPIQGTAADIIKIAMIKVSDRLRRENLRARLILQVHDELIVEAPEDEAERVALLLREEMENAIQLSVPLIAEAYIGKTWYEAKG